MKLVLRKISYDPDLSGDVSLLMEHAMGSFFLNSTEPQLEARMAPGATTWGNDEAKAEAEALLATPASFTAATGMSADKFPDEGFVVVIAPQRIARAAAEAAASLEAAAAPVAAER